MNRSSIIIFIAIFFVAFPLFAIDVNRDELIQAEDMTIEFENYAGPQDVISSVEAIRGIGEGLGEEENIPGARYSYAGRYDIIHASDPDNKTLLNADILILGEAARVDHIDNLRRIISGYIETAYDYRRGDADLLATLITIYNAIYRGQYDFFSQRYSQLVLDNISPEQVGLPLSYREWPGQSEIVIPLAPGETIPGSLNTVDILQLTDKQVREDLSAREDRAITERQATVDLLERLVDELQDEIDTTQNRTVDQIRTLDEEEQAIVQQLSDIELLREQLESDGVDEEELQQIEELQTQEEALKSQQEEVVAEREQTIEEQQQRIAELTAVIRDERSEIAEDLSADPDLRAPTILFPRVVVGIDGRETTLVRIDAATGEVIRRSSNLRIISRDYTIWQSDIIVASLNEDGTRVNLVALDQETFETRRFSDAATHPDGIIVIADDKLYTAVDIDGEWHLGLFDNQLRMIGQSSVTIDPNTAILLNLGIIYVQAIDGRVILLDADNLSNVGAAGGA